MNRLRTIYLSLLFILAMNMTNVLSVKAENYPYKSDYLWLTVPDHADWLYKTGEQAKVEVSFYKYGIPRDGEVNYEIGDDMLKADKKGSFKLKNGRAILNIGTRKTPGFRDLRLFYKLDGKTYQHHIKIGFSVDKIQPYTQEPKDFAAIGLDAEAKEELTTEMQRLTGVENPNSVYQLLDWLESRGYKPDSLGKTQVKELIKTAKEPVKSVLEMRLQLSKSSVKKYTAMKQTACRDNRARGMFSFYGASRTGRWAGRNIQLQNLPQNHLEDLTEARELVKTGSFDDVQMIYDDVPDTLSQLIRTAFIPRQGMKFIVADFSAIEARVIAWLADEQWVLDAFANNKDLYCETASRMFGVPVEKHGINGELRQKGKQCTLSCSYGGAKGALIAMGAIDSGMKEDELQPLVIAWREANPNIVRFWHSLEQCAMKCIKEKTVTKTNRLTFSYEAGFLFIELPSGRRLAYAKPRIGENKFGGESITYMGINAQKKWDRLETFGGKIAENVCQAVARDLLMYSMQTLSHCFIVATVHDEIIIEASKDMSLDVVCQQMARTPKWAEGLILRADGYECEYYKKD